MKRFVLSFIVFFVMQSVSAQNVSYECLMDIAEIETLSGMSSKLRSLDYILDEIGTNEYGNYVIWGWGSASYNKETKKWTHTDKPWAMFKCSVSDINIPELSFTFSSYQTFEELKGELKIKGWKVDKELVSAKSIDSQYHYDDDITNTITLTENADPTEGYTISYVWPWTPMDLINKEE